LERRPEIAGMVLLTFAGMGDDVPQLYDTSPWPAASRYPAKQGDSKFMGTQGNSIRDRAQSYGYVWSRNA
jgi:hypothetical protein